MNTSMDSSLGIGKFDPEVNRNNAHVAFMDFVDSFEFEYEAVTKDPPPETEDKAQWHSINKRKIFLGRYASRTFQTEFKDTVPEEERENLTFKDMVAKMAARYAPSRNYTLANYDFHRIMQEHGESFDVFANRLKKEAKSCQFKCAHASCDVADIMVRDQIIIGCDNDEIRKNALKNQWSLKELVENGRKLEAASFSAQRISSSSKDTSMVARIKPGKYSQLRRKQESKRHIPTCMTCCNKSCKGGKSCLAAKMKCFACGKQGHFKGSRACKKSQTSKKTRRVEPSDDSDSNSSYSDESDASSFTPNQSPKQINRVNRHRMRLQRVSKKKIHRLKYPRYQVSVIIKEKIVTAFADTGADINVMSHETAKSLSLPLQKTRAKVRPYGSKSLKCAGYYEGSVMFGDAFAVGRFYVIRGPVETLLSGKLCEALGIISFNGEARYSGKKVFRNTISGDGVTEELIREYPDVFTGIGTLKDYKVHFYVDETVPPVAQAARPIPFHIKKRFTDEIQSMVDQDIIEEHSGPAPWVSNPVLTPKDNGNIRITIDMREANKAIKATNIPIPRVEDIKVQLSGAKVFSKLDFRSAFHQLQLDDASRQLTVFHAGEKLMRYKRLTMGAKPASGEMTKALTPIFNNIAGCHVIHDDVIIAGKSRQDHDLALHTTLRRIRESGLTLNAEKCIFRKQEIPFWGMVVTSQGVKPDPDKVKALKDASKPESKDDVMSFLCFVQSFSDFIPHLSKRTKHMRKLTKKHTPFRWTNECENEFRHLKETLQTTSLINYFDPDKLTFIFVDAHRSGLSAILAQGQSETTCQPVAYASRATRDEETRYPQIDLEAASIDFALRRFRRYIEGGPQIIVLTDHKPLVSIFSNTRKGSIRTDRIKLRHQDIAYKVIYFPGKSNPADYLSRHATPFSAIPRTWKQESIQLEKTVWLLQYSPHTQSLNFNEIITKTKKDSILGQVMKYVHKGYIPKSKPQFAPYLKIFDQLTIVDGMLLKGEKIILPRTLQKHAIKKAHQGGHPGMDSVKRRLRHHFWFPKLNAKVEEAIQNCEPCQLFTNKRTKEPIMAIPPPDHPWQDVSIDLFGPMPDKRHIVVVQDLKTRFPAASIVRSTAHQHVIPAIQDIYTNYGNPDSHRTDNGPPFNSKEFADFSAANNITHTKVFPYHPQANPVETFMRPLGKAMKIAEHTHQNKDRAIKELLSAYRSTPHPSTGCCPGELMFRGGYKQDVSRNVLSQEEIQNAYEKDTATKEARNHVINLGPRAKKSDMQKGMLVIIRNNIRHKFDPIFGPHLHQIVATDGSGAILLNLQNGKTYRRHCNDIKIVSYIPSPQPLVMQDSPWWSWPENERAPLEEDSATQPEQSTTESQPDEEEVVQPQLDEETVIQPSPQEASSLQETPVRQKPETDRNQKIPRALKQLQNYNKPGFIEMEEVDPM